MEMNFRRLAVKSARFYWRFHAGTIFGVAITAAVLLGALFVGDSVRHSLRQFALNRVGTVVASVHSGERFFQADLAQRLGSNYNAAAAIFIQGISVDEQGNRRVNQTSILGVTEKFFRFAIKPVLSDSKFIADSAWINETLASRLNLKVGDSVLLRLKKPSLLSAEVPVSSSKDARTALRLTVGGILNAEQFGNFSLYASQIPTPNIFVPLETLQAALEVTNQANLLLVSPSQPGMDKDNDGFVTSLQNEIRRVWSLADAQLEIISLAGAARKELRSKRVFLDPPVIAALERAAQTSKELILTYFVNEISLGTNSTPYSMISGLGSRIGVPENGIILSDWLAEDLGARNGDKVAIRFFVAGPKGQLEERTNHFQVHEIIPLASLDKNLMPDFPGLSKAESSHDWDTGFPVELKRIRPKDEEYWKNHRGTPKALIGLNQAVNLWSNRFGSFTAARFDSFAGDAGRILQGLEPEFFGLQARPLLDDAIKSSQQSQDFGSLFLGLSFFLIFSGLLISVVLFQFAILQRNRELGSLMALGFRPKQIRRLLMIEAFLLTCLGVALGGVLAWGYARAMLLALNTVWKGAVGTSHLVFHFSYQTVLIGGFATVFVVLAVVFWTLRSLKKRSCLELLQDQVEQGAPSLKNNRFIGLATIVFAVAALGMFLMPIKTGKSDPLISFGGGSLLLFALLLGVNLWLRKLEIHSRPILVNAWGLALRQAVQKRKRSLASIILFASGCFLVVSISAHRLESSSSPENRRSGTGGFAFMAQSTEMIVKDLNLKEVQETLGLDSKILSNTRFVPLRLRLGEEASCLNLNRAQTPHIVGVDPADLHATRSFEFKEVWRKTSNESSWTNVLGQTVSDEIPVVGDYASIRWAMGQKVGNLLEIPGEVRDKEKLRLAGALDNTILQGYLVMSEKDFLRVFPGETGFRMFLIDCPSNEKKSVEAELSRGLQDYGFELADASRRMEDLNAVQNTYLQTFQILGGLGVLLGTFGFGAVVLRNVLDRQFELALFRALGFSRRQIGRSLFLEHGLILGLGLLTGVVSGVLAVWPARQFNQEELRNIGFLLVLILFTGYLITFVITRAALSHRMTYLLKKEA